MKILELLKQHGIEIKAIKGDIFIECPVCREGTVAKLLKDKKLFKCFACGEEYTFEEALKEVLPELSDEEIKLMLEENTEDYLFYLGFYEKLGWDLVPLVARQKRPSEKNWTKKIHKNKSEWINWLKAGQNLGVKTGNCSNITVVDIDGELPEIFKKYLDKTLVQKTQRGYHFFFNYVPDLPKTRIVIDGIDVDIENDGGQVVIPPSIIDYEGILRKRSFLNNKKPIDFPEELLNVIKKNLSVPVKTFSEEWQEHLKTENFNLRIIKEGEGRNNFLIHLGGLLRKRFGMGEVKYILKLVNNHFCYPPLPERELKYLTRSLEKYEIEDDSELKRRIYEYMKIVKEAHKSDIQKAFANFLGGRIDRLLSIMTEEGYLIRNGDRYRYLERPNWKTELIEVSKPVDFKVPYFDDIAYFSWGDILLIASKSGFGKTVIAMNIVKRLVNQGIKPYYICLETGSRFATTALRLGLQDGDLYWTFIADPTKIELEENSITIIDWLLVRDKAKSDLIFQYLAEQVYKTNSFLIVFQQLKDNGEYFAPNMVQQFPAFACKFLYKKEDERADGYFKITKVRDPKIQHYPRELYTIYDWQTREVKRIEEIIE